MEAGAVEAVEEGALVVCRLRRSCHARLQAPSPSPSPSPCLPLRENDIVLHQSNASASQGRGVSRYFLGGVVSETLWLRLINGLFSSTDWMVSRSNKV